jgi:hypothetical protein
MSISKEDRKKNNLKREKEKDSRNSPTKTPNSNEGNAELENEENNISDKNNRTDPEINKKRKLTDEESLAKMKENLPNDQALTKTFITRKLLKRIMISRNLDYENFDESVKNVELSIPKKSGANNFIKFSIVTNSEEEFKINSNLIYFIKDLFITHFVILKKKENFMKIIFGGTISKDIVYFLKQISTLEFKEKYLVKSAKIRVFAFYEELVYEFSQKYGQIDSKNLIQNEIDEYVKQFEYLTYVRKCYEEIKQIRI